MERYDISVVGMRVEKFIGTRAVTEGDDAYYNCDTEECNDEKFILFCLVKSPYEYKKLFTITLFARRGWCGSGYTTASWGNMKIKEVDDFGPFTHAPKDGKKIKLENAYYDYGLCFEKVTVPESDEDDADGIDDWHDEDIHNNVFVLSKDGGDKYYPSGYVNVNMNLFTECKRAFEDRPVWIFFGESAAGKSTLAYYLSENKVVFETDSLDDGKLPDTIWADIIVVGNKYNITVQDIAPHLPEGTEIISVNFMKGYLND